MAARLSASTWSRRSCSTCSNKTSRKPQAKTQDTHMKKYLYLLVCAASAMTPVANADLTPEQKAIDFSGMVSMLDRRYAPIPLVWHGQRYNILKASEWIEAARR